MIHLKVEDAAVIPLSVDTSSAVPLTFTEAFIEGGGGANLMPNKNATASTSQVEVTPDVGYDGMEKVTIAAIPAGVLDADVQITGRHVTGIAKVTTDGYVDHYHMAVVETDINAGSATTPDTTITPNTNISVNPNGLVSVGVTGSQSITPSVQAGYVASGTAGTVSVVGGGNYQLTVETGIIVTPSTSQMTVDVDGKYMLGDIVVDPIPSQYIVPSGTLSITSNGSGIDVAQYAAVDVNVSGGGSSVVSGTFTPTSNLRSITLSDCVGKTSIVIFPISSIVAISGARTHWGDVIIDGALKASGSTNSSGTSWSLSTGSNHSSFDGATGTVTINTGVNSNYGGYYTSGMTYGYRAW